MMSSNKQAESPSASSALFCFQIRFPDILLGPSHLLLCIVLFILLVLVVHAMANEIDMVEAGAFQYVAGCLPLGVVGIACPWICIEITALSRLSIVEA